MLSLFDEYSTATNNLLPKDGEVYYHGQIMASIEANKYFDELMNGILWENDQAMIFGKKIITKRKVAWYGDTAFSYTYSGITKQALIWTPALLALKTLAEKNSNETYNSCLLNLYHTGKEGMAWHSDGEKDLKKNGAIASLSFGAERKFAFKHKRTGEVVNTFLEHGSLIVMKGTTQTHWLHRLPPTKKVLNPRINLTFRTIINPGILVK
jgi:alkylated DNA repair dioxygenase AlkB